MAAESKQNEVEKKQLNIEIVSDNICPWCYVGKRNLEQALSKLNREEIDVHIQWTAFELNSARRQSIDKRTAYAAKFGADQVQIIENRMKNVGLNCSPSIKFKWDGLIGNTCI